MFYICIIILCIGMGLNEMKDDEQELLAKLKLQFGDMDVSGMLFTGTDGDNYLSNNCDDESDSSLEEPTATMLAEWQEAQFAIGQMKLEAKTIISGSNLQRRRQNKTVSERTLLREYEEEEANECVSIKSVPDLGDVSSIFFPTDDIEGDNSDLELVGGVHPLLHKLVDGDSEVLGTKWTRLYSSSDGDGLSFYNLIEKIRGYNGPTVMLLGGTPSASKCLGNNVQKERVSIGVFTIDSYQESTEYFGTDDDCFLFSLDYEKNNVKFIRPKSRSSPSSSSSNTAITKKYLYCHTSLTTKNNKGRKDNTHGSLHGLCIGGTASRPRLHITESLEECRALEYDSLFQDGDLLGGKCSDSLNYFDVDSIEVWGVGGYGWINDALQAQSKAKAIHAASLEKARKVDKKQFLDHFKNDAACTTSDLFGNAAFAEERCDL